MKITVDEKTFFYLDTPIDIYGEFEMPDEYVETLVALIREKQTTDIEELDVETSHPDIYKLLRDETVELLHRAAIYHDMRELILDDGWDVDTDELIDYCRQNCGLKNSEFYEIYEEYFDSDDDDDEEDDFDEEAYVEVHKKRGKDFYDCFWAWYRHYVDTAPYEDIDELFHALYDPDYKCDFSFEDDFDDDTDLFIPQQIIDLANLENNK
jgi:hypothetical protein